MRATARKREKTSRQVMRAIARKITSRQVMRATARKIKTDNYFSFLLTILISMHYKVFKTKISTHFRSPSNGNTASLG